MRAFIFASLFIGVTVFAHADDDIDYQRHIKPLLAHKCAACHGSLSQEAGLRLDASQLIHRGGDNGPVINPGSSLGSELIDRVSSSDPDYRMPPDGEGEPLTKQQIQMLSQWIDAGAVFPADEIIPVAPMEHWAYQIPKRKPIPAIDGFNALNPIDSFLMHEQQRVGLKPADLADRHTLLRRLYFDLIGLPPTREQLQAFVDDDSPQAWQTVVESLFESPHYGERWARHWMDVWRYSDWDGYKQELRSSHRHIWRWRDWIVQSLNDDKGYDQMVVEMLAGDEIAPSDPAVLPATGYLARNYHKSNRNIWLDATVEHTAKAFLGVTLNCARCHDHKYDPLPQTAYYQFRAIFEPHQVRIDEIPGQPDIAKNGLPRAFDRDAGAQTFLYIAGNEKQPDKDNPLGPAIPDVLGGQLEISPVLLPLDAYYPSLRDFVVNRRLSDARRRLAEADKQLREALTSASDKTAQTEDNKQTDLEQLQANKEIAELGLKSLQARLAADRAKVNEIGKEQIDQLSEVALQIERELKVRQANLAVHVKTQALKLAEGGDETDQKKKEAAVAQAKKQLADAEQKLKTAQEAVTAEGSYTPFGQQYPETSSGRRLALARWITSDKNPLTARVAVNHIWMRHFDAPLVDNVFDFGLRSPRPRHADLLDWLAVELMENNWSMKHLHRLIVTSRSWRLASTAAPEIVAFNQAIDADNHYLWRQNIRRLDAESIRDSVLSVTGQLDASLGGPDIDFNQGETSRRRSLYLRHAYEKQMKMLVIFDAASPNECYRRSQSIIPQQALALTNSSLALSKSRILAADLWKETQHQDRARLEFVDAAFLRILSRPPLEEEQKVCLQFLVDQAALLSDSATLDTFAGGVAAQVEPSGDPHQRARENLVHVLMNHNDFVTLR